MRDNGLSRTIVAPSGTFTYGYDGDGRMNALSDPSRCSYAWAYKDNGWLYTQTLKNSSAATVAATTYTYNALGETTDLVNKDASGTTLTNYGSLVYDGAGDRTSLTATVAAHTGYSGTTSYTYDSNGTNDARSQLVGESSTRNGSYSEAESYDGAGNATSFRGSTKAYNGDNHLSTNTYDGVGNPTTYSSTSCTYDPENRMTAYGSALTAGYDGDGLRAWKNNGTVTTYFLYDGDKPVCELSSAGSVTATNTFGANGLVARTVGSTTTLYTFDPQGSVAQRIGTSGSVSSSDCYNAWGSKSSTGSADVFQFGAQWGYYTDAESGLVLCTHRYYDPATGRWLTRDPIGYAGGVNLYGYCGNEPVDQDDESGLRWIIPTPCIVLHVVILVFPCSWPAKAVLEVLVILLCDTIKGAK